MVGSSTEANAHRSNADFDGAEQVLNEILQEYMVSCSQQ